MDRLCLLVVRLRDEALVVLGVEEDCRIVSVMLIRAEYELCDFLVGHACDKCTSVDQCAVLTVHNNLQYELWIPLACKRKR